MALGQIGVDIAEQVAAGPVQPGPQQGQALGEGLAASLGGECVLGRELPVEAAVGQAGRPGDLGDPDAVEAVRAEQPPRRLDDGRPVLRRLLLGHLHHRSPRPPLDFKHDGHHLRCQS